MANDSAGHWNQRYTEHPGVPRAAQVLVDNRHLLPVSGDALDLACGLGGNALFLAEQGLATWAWDSSEVAIERLRQTAQQRGLLLHAEVRDVIVAPPLPQMFDVIVVSRFLERRLAAALCEALRHQGLLFYQTFVRQAVDTFGPSNPAYRLEPQELLRLFQTLRLVVYRDEGVIGDTTRGLRNEAVFVGQKG